MRKKTFYTWIVLGILFIATITLGVHFVTNQYYPKYGVVIGAKPADAYHLSGYDVLVVDAEYFTKNDIDILKMKNNKVYSYLNIGSVEKFRDCYSRFRDVTLGTYENWPDEDWVNVAHAKWQDYIVDQAAKKLADKGIDGFWIDNTDVYFFFPRHDIFDGIVRIIQRLEAYKLDLILNGGNIFVKQAVLDPQTPKCNILGVNQESVFTAYDFKKKKSIPASQQVKEYFLDYLNRASKQGLEVFITEYEDLSVEKELSDYCKKRKWKFFLSPSINLDADF